MRAAFYPSTTSYEGLGSLSVSNLKAQMMLPPEGGANRGRHLSKLYSYKIKSMRLRTRLDAAARRAIATPP